MFRTLSLAALAVSLGIHPATSKADVIPFSTANGYVYTSDGSAIASHDVHYEQASGGLIIDRSQSHAWGSTGFAARSIRDGNEVALGAKTSSSGAPAGEFTHVGGSATYNANVSFTPSDARGRSLTPTKATFQFAVEGSLVGGQNAWFSLFADRSGVFGAGRPESLWQSGDVSQNLRYVENAGGGYNVDGVVEFSVDLAADADGGFTTPLQLSLSSGAASIEGFAARSDFMNTVELIGIAFEGFEGRTVEELGWDVDFNELPADLVEFNDPGPRGIDGPRAGGVPNPEPASMLVWGAVAAMLLFCRNRVAG